MTWFKVDDGLHSHPKAMASSLAALGLWALAGSWSGKHLTDGFIPDHAIPSLSRGQDALARELVAAGLWTRVRGGYRFHDWHERNPSKEKVESDRAKKAAAGRAGGIASGQVRRSKQRSKNEASASALVEPPTRPDRREGRATQGSQGESSVTRASPEPPLRCQEHLNDTSPPNCGPCADARRAHDRWRAARDARLRAAPQCPRPAHRGQPADNCALCRSERIAEGAE